MNRASFLVLALIVISPASTIADITYVDAIPSDKPGGNTTLGDGTPVVGGSVGYVNDDFSTGFNDDDLWEYRTTFGNGDVIWESFSHYDPSNTSEHLDDSPVLRTRITGLIPGASYHVYGYFWSPIADPFHSSRANWDIMLGNSSGSLNPMSAYSALTTVDTYNGNLTGTAQFGTADDGDAPDPDGPNEDYVLSNPTFTNEVDGHIIQDDFMRDLMQYYLGIRIADTSDGFIDVYIDDDQTVYNGGLPGRSWYDGVGYAQVPEPTTCTLALALLCLVMGRRRSF